jgi:hypothetical protein
MGKIWETAHASAVGAGHLKTGTPCQDSSVVEVSDDGTWVVVVVSDGAGSAKRSEEGSKYTAAFFSQELLKLVEELSTRAPGSWINDFVIERVLETRKWLRNHANSDDISDFHCTLVACVQGPSGGFAIHLGDGAITGGYSDSSKNQSKHLFVSRPENGEYANETFFITEPSWIKHLRITPMPRMDWFLCCTDGGESLALVGDQQPKIGFLEPVLETLRALKTESERNAKIKEYLSDTKADKVTGDDKTIAVAWTKDFAGDFSSHLLPDDGGQTPTKRASNVQQVSASSESDDSKTPNNHNFSLLSKKRFYPILSTRYWIAAALIVVSALSVFAAAYTFRSHFIPEGYQTKNHVLGAGDRNDYAIPRQQGVPPRTSDPEINHPIKSPVPIGATNHAN